MEIANKPMTLEQLREMRENTEIIGPSVLISWNGVMVYGVLDEHTDDGICAVVGAGVWLKEKDYGKTWLAYAQQPDHIDPETLPIVRQLREKMMLTEANQQHFKEERDEFELRMKETAEAANLELGRREKLIAELREQLERVTEQRDGLFELLNDVCKDVRETHVDDSVCGLCEYDGAHISESGDWDCECPGFDSDDCFCMKKSLRKKYGQEE